MDANVRLAIECGMPVEEAIYMTTYTPARRMGFQDRGAIASGFLADFILVDDLEKITIESVYKKGKCVHQRENKMAYPSTKPKFPAHFYDSLQCKSLTAKDLQISVETQQNTVTCNVIQIQEVGTFTKHVQRTVQIWENSGLSFIIVMECYGKNGNIGYGLVENALKEKGAIATT
ncbi:Amidohydrolase family protein [Carnobacterium iners]|nr:Amidohydrolase family protein [Carnobacterium iners]